MFKILFLITITVSLSGIYDYTVKDISGNEISLSSFRGKWILIVNTASDSRHTDQYAGLEKLYQKYKDSLVIIAFPSNSFGHDTEDNAAIKKRINNQYKIHYILAQKTNVTGNEQDPVYSWLTQQSRNAVMSNTIRNDFFKFLINKSGTLVGAFSSSVDPMSQEIQSVLQNN